MKFLWPFAMLVAGATACSSPSEDGQNEEREDVVEVSRVIPTEEQDDAQRGIYHVRLPCAGKLKVRKPYAVLPDGWGDWEVRARLEALDDNLAAVLHEGFDPQQSFGFSGTPHKGDGVRTWIKAHTEGNLRGTANVVPPGHELPKGYRSWAILQADGGATWPVEYYYLSPDQRVAMRCGPSRYPGGSEVPNPTCDADVADESGRFLFRAAFPIRVSGRVNEIVAAGERVFGPTIAACLAPDKGSAEHPASGQTREISE